MMSVNQILMLLTSEAIGVRVFLLVIGLIRVFLVVSLIRVCCRQFNQILIEYIYKQKNGHVLTHPFFLMIPILSI